MIPYTRTYTRVRTHSHAVGTGHVCECVHARMHAHLRAHTRTPHLLFMCTCVSIHARHTHSICVRVCPYTPCMLASARMHEYAHHTFCFCTREPETKVYAVVPREQERRRGDGGGASVSQIRRLHKTTKTNKELA